MFTAKILVKNSDTPHGWVHAALGRGHCEAINQRYEQLPLILFICYSLKNKTSHLGQQNSHTMKFIDRAKIFVKAGDGGRGCASFRREKFVPKGGPDGGDGGNGGHVFFQVDQGLSTLVGFRKKVHFKAGRGSHGKGKNMHGKKGSELVLRPPGTMLYEAETERLVADLTTAGEKLLIFKGGRGGRGNTALSYRGKNGRLVDYAEDGQPGEEGWLRLELKLLADVGLVGLPNAGKSTFISAVSEARPKIADYPFTTLDPQLGVVRYNDFKSFVLADIPGLIEGPARGRALAFTFCGK